jgi:hypothetical protein
VNDHVLCSLVHFLLDEIVGSTLHRCLDPVTMETSVSARRFELLLDRVDAQPDQDTRGVVNDFEEAVYWKVMNWKDGLPYNLIESFEFPDDSPDPDLLSDDAGPKKQFDVDDSDVVVVQKREPITKRLPWKKKTIEDLELHILAESAAVSMVSSSEDLFYDAPEQLIDIPRFERWRHSSRDTDASYDRMTEDLEMLRHTDIRVITNPKFTFETCTLL